MANYYTLPVTREEAKTLAEHQEMKVSQYSECNESPELLLHAQQRAIYWREAIQNLMVP